MPQKSAPPSAVLTGTLRATFGALATDLRKIAGPHKNAVAVAMTAFFIAVVGCGIGNDIYFQSKYPADIANHDACLLKVIDHQTCTPQEQRSYAPIEAKLSSLANEESGAVTLGLGLAALVYAKRKKIMPFQLKRAQTA
jgi:hypothetical protein